MSLAIGMQERMEVAREKDVRCLTGVHLVTSIFYRVVVRKK